MAKLFNAYIYEDQLEIPDDANDLCYILKLCELRSYCLAYITDAEGIEKQVEELPELAIILNVTNLTCDYCIAEGEETGFIEVLEEHPAEDGAPAVSFVKITLESGDVFTANVYEDQMEILDEENDLCYILVRNDTQGE